MSSELEDHSIQVESSRSPNQVPDEGVKGELYLSEFTPRAIVLAKVKGYPPWPAMVLEESILPEEVLAKKPKSVKQLKKKGAKKVFVLPVRFFSDDTYIWMRSTDVKVLTQEMSRDFLENKKKRKGTLLQYAYELANNPPEMELFAKWGSKGKPPKTGQKRGRTASIEEEDVDLPDEIGDDGDDIEEEKEEEEEEDDDDFGNSGRKRPKKDQKSEKKGKSTKRENSKSSFRKKVHSDEEEDESDWSISEGKTYDYEKGDYIFENQQEQDKFQREFPSANKLSKEMAVIHEEFDELDLQLSELLLSDEIDEPLILDYLHEVKNLDLPKSVVMKSNSLKTFIVVLRKPSEKFPYSKIKREIKKIVSQWADLSVDELKLEDLVLPQEDNLQPAENSPLPHPKEASVDKAITKEQENGVSPLVGEFTTA